MTQDNEFDDGIGPRSQLKKGQQPIYDLIQEHFGSTGTIPERALQLSESLRQVGAGQSKDEVVNFTWSLATLVARYGDAKGPDDPMQDFLVEALHDLQKKGGLITEESDLDWADLPDLPMFSYDKWFDPTDEDECTPEEAAAWMNFNSFVARLTTDTFSPWLNYPHLALSWALLAELPSKDKHGGLALKSKLWNATEWILRSGDVFLVHFSKDEPLDKDAVSRSAALYPLHPIEAGLRGVKQLKFFKKRFGEIAGQRDELGLDEEMVDRLTKSAAVITNVLSKVEANPEEEDYSKTVQKLAPTGHQEKRRSWYGSVLDRVWGWTESIRPGHH